MKILAKGGNRNGFADSLQIRIAADETGGFVKTLTARAPACAYSFAFASEIEIHDNDAFGG
jgi:hypothetical protein